MPWTLKAMVRGDEIGLALGLEAVADLGAGGMELGSEIRGCRRRRLSASSRQCVAGDAGMAAGEIDDVVAQRRRGQRHGLARNHGAGAGEGAGVVGRLVGVGVDDGDLAGARAEDGGRDLAVRRDEPLPISVEPTARW